MPTNNSEPSIRILRAAQRLNDRNQSDESTTIISNAGSEQSLAFAADGEIGADGKDSVEMRADDDEWRRRASFEQSETIAFFIDRDVVQTELAKTFGEIFGALVVPRKVMPEPSRCEFVRRLSRQRWFRKTAKPVRPQVMSRAAGSFGPGQF